MEVAATLEVRQHPARNERILGRCGAVQLPWGSLTGDSNHEISATILFIIFATSTLFAQDLGWHEAWKASDAEARGTHYEKDADLILWDGTDVTSAAKGLPKDCPRSLQHETGCFLKKRRSSMN